MKPFWKTYIEFILRKPLDTLWSIFFPVKCAGCGSTKSALCDKCLAKIPFASTPETSETFAVYDYGYWLVEKIIRDFKYHRKSEAALELVRAASPYIAQWLSDIVQTEKKETIVLVPIPQHINKTKNRGFNQSEMIAKILGQDFDSKVMNLLWKTKATIPQAHLQTKKDRLANLKNSMKVRGFAKEKTIYLLVDDITTTGATFSEARRALIASGAKKVLCVALAHGFARKK